MTDEQLERHVKVLLARVGYVVAPGSPPFRLEARSARETLLLQIKGDRPDEGAAWSTFVGAVAQLSIMAEDGQGALGTLCVVFGPMYKSFVKNHLRGLDPRVEVVYAHADGRLERLRRSWPKPPPGPPREDPCAVEDTVLVKRPDYMEPKPVAPPPVGRAPVEPAPAESSSVLEHPDGTFAIALLAYEVRQGRLLWVTEKGNPVHAPLFADVCRRLGLSIEEESAAKVLHRAVVAFGQLQPDGSG